MRSLNEAGFDGTVDVGVCKVIFRHGYDKVQLKEKIELQPVNQLFWLEREAELLYRNTQGEFFKLNFEKIEL